MGKNVSLDQVTAKGRELAVEATEAFCYPEDQEREPAAPELDAVDRAQFIVDLFGLLFPRSNQTGTVRRKAAFNRFVVLVYMTRPEIIGEPSIDALAEELGVSKWAIYKIREEIGVSTLAY